MLVWIYPDETPHLKRAKYYIVFVSARDVSEEVFDMKLVCSSYRNDSEYSSLLKTDPIWCAWSCNYDHHRYILLCPQSIVAVYVGFRGL